MDYKGIKIYDKVIIVEKTDITEGGYNWKGRTINQGYVVDINNEKMLETAMNWAEWRAVPEDQEKALCNRIFGEGKDYWSQGVTVDQCNEYCKEHEKLVLKHPGIIHEYENGNFTVTLDEAAGRSSQGGKLSFWNCIITGPDGHSFLVGINSELLLHLMMTTTLIKGVCQEKVWLGRIKGIQVGVFTSEMDDFKQAKLDEEARNLKKTSNYKPGDIVETLTSRELYIGEVYFYANKYYERNNWSSRDAIRIIFNKPKKMHAFITLEKDKEIKLKDIRCIELKSTKPAKVVIGHNEEVMLNARNMINNFQSEYRKLRVTHSESSSSSWNLRPFNYFLENMAIRLTNEATPEEIQSDMLRACKFINDNNDKYKITENIKLQKDFSKAMMDKYQLHPFSGQCYFRYYNYINYYKDEEN